MVTVILKSVGSAPNLSSLPDTFPDDMSVEQLRQAIKQDLKWTGPLHLYVNASFMPSPTDTLAALLPLVGTKTQSPFLTISYSITPAWG